MSQARTWFAICIFSASLLNAGGGAAAEEQPCMKVPLDVYTSKSCKEKGVNYAYYEGDGDKRPDFSKAKPVKQGKLKYFDLSPRKRDQHFGMKFTGYLKVKYAGDYTFHLDADDRGRLDIGSKTVVEWGKNRGEIHLAEGVHPITLAYLQGGGGMKLNLAWCVPPPPWHVKEAETRLPVTVSLDHARGRMPPQVYLADLKPLETDKLSFDRKTKNAVRWDVRSKEEIQKDIARVKRECKERGQEFTQEIYRVHGHRKMRAKGSATFPLKPEYQWFSFWGHGHTEIHIDGDKASGVLGGHGGEHPHHPPFPTSKGGRATLVPIPPGAKRLTIKADAEWLRQVGFLTRHPAVARATLYLPGRDPTSLIPLVYNLSGQRVGCRILWAHPGEPMSILFDCSSGETQYFVYLVDRSKKPTRLNWAPKAGLIFETRYLDRYDPAIETMDGFLELWDEADFIAGKKEMTRIWKQFFPFRPYYETTPNFRDALRGARMALARYTGFFHVPDTRKYQFHYKALPGGYFLIDNQLVSAFTYHESKTLREQGSKHGYKRFAVELAKGMHRIEFYQYGSARRFSAQLGWGLPGKEDDLEPFGNLHHGTAFSVWEPVADAGAAPIRRRGKDVHASFTWHHRYQFLGKYPARDIVGYSFAARMTEKPEEAVFRWRFDDGRTAEGERVNHHFLTPGTRKVELVVLDGPDGDVVASASSNVHVHVDWSWPSDTDHNRLRDLISQRAEEFASVTPIGEVVSLYYWARQNHWPELRKVIGSALAQRTEEAVKAVPYTRLLEMAESLGSPAEACYDPAEPFLRAVMDRAPRGGRHWRAAALALADILVTARAEPKKGLQLLEKVKKAVPTVDLAGEWQMAQAERWHCLTPPDNVPDVPKDLNWSDALLPLKVKAEDGRGIWLAKDIQLPASRKGKELVLDLGDMPGSGVILFNGKRLGRPWQWGDGSIVVPAGMQRAGGTNRVAALFQPTDPPDYWAKAKEGAPPTLRVSGPPNSLAKGYVSNPQPLADYYALRQQENRDPMLEELGGSHATEQAVRRALDWFTKHQEEDGRWSCKKHGGAEGHDNFATGIAMLCYLGWGATHTEPGPYRKPLAKAVEWLVGRVGTDGDLTAESSQGMYDQGVATAALAEAYGVTKDPALLKPLRRATTFIVKAQDRHRGGWRYKPRSGSDTSVTGWQVMALASARRAGIRVPGETFGRARKWFNHVGGGPYKGRYGYSNADPRPAMTAEGMVCQQLMGLPPRHLRMIDGVNYLKTALPGGPGKNYYYWYYLTRALHRHGGPVWALWNQRMKQRLLSTQVRDGEHAGSWHPRGEYGNQGGRVMSTGLATLSLEVYYHTNYSLKLCTSRSCKEKGVNYAYYEGKWNSLPDFDKMKPVKKGKLKHISLSPRKRDDYFGMKFTGYLKVNTPGEFTFFLASDDGSRLSIDSKTVIDNGDTHSRRGKRGDIHLAEGVHEVTVTYVQGGGGLKPYPLFAAGAHALPLTPGGESLGLNVTVPHASVPFTDVATRRLTADALLGLGKNEEAKDILMNLDLAWPMPEKTQLKLTSDLREIRRWASGRHTDTVAAIDSINSWLQKHPMLRLDPTFMTTKIEAYANMGDYARAFTLAEQMRRVDMNETQQRELMFAQVKASIKADDMERATEIYKEMKRIAPYSTSTIEAREAIKEAILNE